jgi:hypothetical protein
VLSSWAKAGWKRRRIVMDKNILLQYLECRRESFEKWEGAVQVHKALCEVAPDFYLHLLADPLAEVSQKREMLVNLLGKQVERPRLLEILQRLPASEMLSVLGVIRDQRINRSRARELALACLLGHEQLPTLAATKRQRVAHLLRHVLGERTWSSLKRNLAHETPEGEQFLQREVLRYAWQGDQIRLREVLCFLSGVPFNASQPDLVKILAARQDIGQGQGLPAETLSGLRGIYHPKASLRQVRQLAAPAPLNAHVDGPLTSAYRNAFSGGQETEVAEPLTKASESLPTINGRVAIVLDLSQSMVSSGERLYHPAALALALTRLLCACISEVRLYQVGGVGSLETNALPEPGGVADVALALLQAAQDDAQVVLLITDGYENLRQGDTAQVVDGLRQLGYGTPIYQVVPVYALAENLTLRRLSENIPLLPIAHEEQVREALARMLLASAGDSLADEELQQLQVLLTVR